MWKDKLKDILELGETHLELIKYAYDFISKNDNFIIFGASSGGAKAKALLDNLEKHVACFVDNDINKKGTSFLGKVVKHPGEILMFEHKVIIASDWWFDIQKQLEEKYGLIPKIDFDVILDFFNILESDNTQENFLANLTLNLDKYAEVFNLLEDEASKVTYYRVLKGRIFYGRKNPLFSHTPMPKVGYNEYFHPQVKPQHGDIIVDAGAYNGDTIEQILKDSVEYKKIYAFEPDEQNYNQLMKNTAQYKNIECINCGLWHKTDKLNFLASHDMGSMITKNPQQANQTIEVVSLDEFFKNKEKPTLIKMDIEGAERDALLGAKEIIVQYKPKLQICIYHKPDHLWGIPLLLKNWVEDYKFYIGHHTLDFCETVLYASV